MKKIKKNLVYSLLFFSLIMMSACSPYIHQEEVGKFKVGVDNVAGMLNAQKVYLATRTGDINKDDLIDNNNPHLRLGDGCVDAVLCLEAIANSTSRGKRCPKKILSMHDNALAAMSSEDIYKKVQEACIKRCYVFANKKNGDELKLDVSPQLSAQTRAFNSLNSYATALAGIVDATDATALGKSASEACSSTQQLYSTISTINTQDEDLSPDEKAKMEAGLARETEAVSSVCGLIMEIGAGILARQRLKTLKRVVNEGDPTVNLLANYLAGEARKYNSIVLRNEIGQLQDTFAETKGLKEKDEEYLNAVNSAVFEKDAFYKALKNNSVTVFLNMAEAHGKLKDAVNDPKTQLEPAIESIEKFMTSASNAHKAIKALSEEDEKEKK